MVHITDVKNLPEAEGLLSGSSSDAHTEAQPQRSGLFISCRAAALLGLAWAGSVGWAARTGADPLELASTGRQDDKATPTTLSMMKRTHLSIDAIKGGELYYLHED